MAHVGVVNEGVKENHCILKTIRAANHRDIQSCAYLTRIDFACDTITALTFLVRHILSVFLLIIRVLPICRGSVSSGGVVGGVAGVCFVKLLPMLCHI